MDLRRRSGLFDLFVDANSDLSPSILILRTVFVAMLGVFAISRFFVQLRTNKAKSGFCLRNLKAPLVSPS